MNNTMYKPHAFGLEILRKLSKSNEGLRFNQLNIDDLESEHMNYHLKQLIIHKLVKKNEDIYVLTDTGKDYIGLLNDDKEVVEKQPKVSVLLDIRRENENGDIEHLLCRRLIQPYINKVGRLTGKVRFGESIQESALRELYEETGLECDEKDIDIVQVYHKLRWNESNEVVQDNIFFICSISNTFGDFIFKTPVQENIWISKKDFDNRCGNDIDPFDGLIVSDDIKYHIKDNWLYEDKNIAVGY